jgi:DNA-binding GntR family transcriptional regulator
LRFIALLVLALALIVDNRGHMKPKQVPEQSTLADVAAHRLAQSIVTGELAQGQKLNEAELAERFGMGRGPLREALRQLEGMRLVKRIPNAGARVVVLDRKTLSDLYAVRETLEGLACRLAAAQMSDDEIAQLSTLLDKHEEQIKKQGGKVYSQSEGDLDFHYQIVRGSRNQMLMDLLGGEQYQLLRMCRFRTSRNAQRTKPALNQHRQIVDALVHRDGELAEMLMLRHIQGAWDSISEMIDKEEESAK